MKKSHGHLCDDMSRIPFEGKLKRCRARAKRLWYGSGVHV